MLDVANNIKEALKKKDTIVLGAQCSITYSGRAESFLPSGQRVILIKEDGTLIVHQPTGNNPVNYMKPGTSFSLSTNKNMVLKANNLALKEHMTITIEDILFFVNQKILDNESIILQGNEKDFSDMLYASPELIEDGFVPLSREEHTQFGFVDIFGHDTNNTLVVIECKRFKAGPDAVTQLRRYVEKIKKNKGLSKVRGMLIAPEITKNALAMLTEYGYTYKAFDPPKFKLKHKKDQKRLGEY